MRRFLMALMLCSLAMAAQAEPHYPWPRSAEVSVRTVESAFPPPAGFVRTPAPANSFASWLRGLPLKPDGSPVLLHNGQPKYRQDVHAAVIDIDIGARDLQQCADAVMRLRAEWLRAAGRAQEIAFNDTGGGKPMSYARYAAGERPRPEGRGLVWSKSAAADQSYPGFRKYMDTVFNWAGTHSLERELISVPISDIAAGDVFIKGGFPGHAVLVVDVALNASGERRFLLAQSFMPAQSIHILTAADRTASPWYAPGDPKAPFATPEWVFPPSSLKRWK